MLQSTFLYKTARRGLLPLMLALPVLATAQPPVKSSLEGNTMAWMLILVMAVLLLVIILLTGIILNARSIYSERLKKERQQTGASGAAAALLLMLLPAMGMAQDKTTVAVAATKKIGGLSPVTFYMMIGVIVLEAIVIMALIYVLKFMVGIERKVRTGAERKPLKIYTWWWKKMNRAVSIENEKDIDLSHDYDGIRELDNKVPPWWRWAFIASIVFGAVYMWRYHVAQTAPLQLEEYNMAMVKAAEEKEAYLKNAAANVDENTVTMLDAGGIAAGKALFTSATCVQCHGSNGEGNNVGPNLTDAYWIHGGSLKDIFKTVKYGWVDKGMKSWKDDLTPLQIAQVSSYIKTLQGTNPPNAKEPQGELYREAAGADSIGAKPRADTTAAKPPVK